MPQHIVATVTITIPTGMLKEGEWYQAIMAYDGETGDIKICIYPEKTVELIGYEKALEQCLGRVIETESKEDYDGVFDEVSNH